MNLASRCTRIAALALTAVALAASPAWAQPVDMSPAHTEASVPDHKHQDLRSADAIDAASHPAPARQDMRSPDTIDAAFNAQRVSHPDARTDTTPAEHTDPGLTMAVTAAILSGGFLLLGLMAAFVIRTHRAARTHISA